MRLKNILIGRIGIDSLNRVISINCFKNMALKEKVPICIDFDQEKPNVGFAHNFKYSNGELRGDITLFLGLDLKNKIFRWGGYFKKKREFGHKKYIVEEIDFVIIGIIDSYNDIYNTSLPVLNPNSNIIVK